MDDDTLRQRRPVGILASRLDARDSRDYEKYDQIGQNEISTDAGGFHDNTDGNDISEISDLNVPENNKDVIDKNNPEDSCSTDDDDQSSKSMIFENIHISESPCLLESDSPAVSFRGFVNLAGILFVFANARAVAANLQRYGVLFSPREALRFLLTENGFGVLATLLAVLFCQSISFLIDGIAASRKNDDISNNSGNSSNPNGNNNNNVATASPGRIWLLMTSTNLVLALVLPALTVLWYENSMIVGVFLLTFTVNTWLKMVSWSFVHFELRACGKWDKYIESATLSNYIYLMSAPTLCYQLEYPRSEVIRPEFILRKAAGMLISVAGMMAFWEQTMHPMLVEIAPRVGVAGSRIEIAEQVLNMAVPNLVNWLMFAFTYFYLMLNLQAELTRFGDRAFFADWWNSHDLSEFWRKWNIPIHAWLTRHVYKPALGCLGLSKMSASLFVFFISACLHEYIVSVASGSFRLWGFWGMMGQVPLIYVSKAMRGFWKGPFRNAGNVVFWISIIFGQPLLILLYYSEWMKKH